jgi:serine/threonine protein kinase
LAEDTKLHRKVSLKFLSTRFIQDPEPLRRFEQEARAASALNHPNIIHIYEIGHIDSSHFIAAEYLDGATLRSCLATTPLQTSHVLDIAVQVAQCPSGGTCQRRSASRHQTGKHHGAQGELFTAP